VSKASRAVLPLLLACWCLSANGADVSPTLLPEPVIAALAEELSGETAKQNLEFITRFHRIRGSRPFRAAAEHIAERARSYGLSEVRIEEFPADGKIFYGTQRSRPAWDAEFAELWELRKEGDGWTPSVRLASWEAMPITLAQDSESAEVTADLVDVGEGTKESDYAGKDVSGKIVLAAAQPGPVSRLAVGKHGAAGIVSYALNQPQAWRGENENLVRWGHLETFGGVKTFGFMVSLKQARGLRERLARGEAIRLRASVKAGQHPGAYSIVTAAIPGADEKLRDEEIVFSCHLDHQKPGANDNASGCVTILEVARTLQRLISEKKIARPARTLRFVWPPEIEGTVTILNAKPEWARRIKAAIHMDMVGGGPETKAVFHVTRGPMSVPSFVFDVADSFAEFVNEQSYEFATTGRAKYPLTAPEGGKEPLRAKLAPFSMGSDHQVYMDSSWSIPSVYMNDWPDRYIHTNFDTPANIDPTKLKRAGFIGAATGYYLARMSAADLPALTEAIAQGRFARISAATGRRRQLPTAEADNLLRGLAVYEQGIVASIRHFVPEAPAADVEVLGNALMDLLGYLPGSEAAAGDAALVFRRNAEPRGPTGVFGYDYFDDKFGEENARKLKLPAYRGLWGDGGDYAYEVLNFVDGKRTAGQIRDAVSAEFGPVPLEHVVEYLRALESIKVIERVP
jgi:aminopeptidase YwaD